MKDTIEQIINNHFVSKDSFRENMTGILNDGDVIAATSGHVLVEIDLSTYPELSGIPHTLAADVTFPDYSHLIKENDHPLVKSRVAVNDLYTDPSLIHEKDFEKVEKCNVCRGIGVIHSTCDCEYCEGHEDDCWKCGGDGQLVEFDKYKSYVDTDDSRFRATYLNAVVNLYRAIGIEVVDVYQDQPNSALCIETEGVWCVVMPIMMDVLDYRDYEKVVHTIALNQEAEKV